MIVETGGHEVTISSPDKLYFPAEGLTKADLVGYYLAVEAQLLPHCVDRPCNLERYPDGVDGPSFVQKRVPVRRPAWLRTVEVTFGSGATADELCPASLADVLWAVNLGAITVHPWAMRMTPQQGAGSVTGADELRIDLDPMPGVDWRTVVQVAHVVGEVLEEHGVTPFVKTSGASGIHVVARISPHPFLEVRAAAVALAREVERRTPSTATTSWWRENRGQRVFIDYNQNLWDRTTACAYAVRATGDARVSFPVRWDELDDVDPADATVRSVPGLIAQRGDPIAELDRHVSALDGLLEQSAKDAASGLEELPLPPHYPKLPREPRRVPPSRAAD